MDGAGVRSGYRRVRTLQVPAAAVLAAALVVASLGVTTVVRRSADPVPEVAPLAQVRPLTSPVVAGPQLPGVFDVLGLPSPGATAPAPIGVLPELATPVVRDDGFVVGLADVEPAVDEDVEEDVADAPLDDEPAQRQDDVPGRTPDSILPLLDLDELAATASRVGIPARAVAAYASAALAVAEEQPGCGLTWITLAGIGWVESRHGTIGDNELLPDGSLREPIIGVALDGSRGVRAIRDTDGGALDGDATWDRAVGPMQFIPSTWARWQTDATGDGDADPQHIDDAALAAGRYLCAGGGDLRQTSAWARAIHGYNRSDAYVHAVLEAANHYAARANDG